MLGDDVVRHDSPADQMLLNDSFENRRVAVPVPGAFRIDGRHGAFRADPEAVRLRPKHAAFLRKAEFLEPALQILPGLEAPRAVAALRRLWVRTEKDVPGRRGTR